jgi:hypothetical protein
MGVAALISWLVTALFGLYLLAVWLIENDVTHRGAAASRLPAPVIVGHVLLALTGLVFWAVRLARGRLGRGGDPRRCCHPGPDHVYPVDPGAPCLRGGRSQGGPAEFDFPAERAFPVSVVAGHGLLAGTTFTPVLVTMLTG